MKKYVLILFLILVSILLNSNTMSHIPTSINISYNQETNTLYVTVYHDTVDPNTHYIYLIRIYMNAT